jgi:probable rRNA maturation factor
MILNQQRRIPVPLKPLNDFHHRLCVLLHLPEPSFTVCFVSDSAIRRWNHAYRGKDAPTDVLSFPFGQNSGRSHRAPLRSVSRATSHFPRVEALAGEAYLGDVAISPSVARRNAQRSGRPLGDELRVLILHGALHLLGFDHESDNGEMNRLERRLRRRLGLPL